MHNLSPCKIPVESIFYFARKYPRSGYLLGVLTHTTTVEKRQYALIINKLIQADMRIAHARCDLAGARTLALDYRLHCSAGNQEYPL